MNYILSAGSSPCTNRPFRNELLLPDKCNVIKQLDMHLLLNSIFFFVELLSHSSAYVAGKKLEIFGG